MYIINPDKIKNKYKCQKVVAEYLMNTCNIPLLSKDGVNYCFMNTPELDEALKKIPLWIHICEKLNL